MPSNYMDTTQDIATLDAEIEGLLASVKNGQLVLSSIQQELTSIESEVDTVEAELAKIEQEFAPSEEQQRKEEEAMLAAMAQDVVDEEAEDVADAE